MILKSQSCAVVDVVQKFHWNRRHIMSMLWCISHPVLKPKWTSRQPLRIMNLMDRDVGHIQWSLCQLRTQLKSGNPWPSSCIKTVVCKWVSEKVPVVDSKWLVFDFLRLWPKPNPLLSGNNPSIEMLKTLVLVTKQKMFTGHQSY
jgi:hypothetical protein